MESNENMQKARKYLTYLAGQKANIAVFIGPFNRKHLGRQTFQALQSVVVKNSIETNSISFHFDEEIFSSQKEAERLQKLFKSMSGCKIFAKEDSKTCAGIQVADLVAHSFGQIIKESLTGKKKIIDIGGKGTGYAEGTEANLGWTLLMNLRYALFTRQVVQKGEDYSVASNPVIIDPKYDDPVEFAMQPILLGWGVQIALSRICSTK